MLLTLVDRNGNVSSLDVPPAQYRSPRISPDGEHVAVEIVDAAGQSHVWIYDLAGDSAIRRLTQTGNNARPIWTPDGDRVSFASERDGGWGIFERPADGSTLAERLTMAEDGRQHFPDSWSPDGQTLAYTEAPIDSIAEWDLWTYSRADGDSELTAGGAGNQFSGVFSPDGQWLAYGINDVGIQVQPFPPTGVVHQITNELEQAPVWTSGGDELIFRSSAATGGPLSIKVLDVNTAGGITFGNLRTLPIQGAQMSPGYRDFDVSPDGERLIMIYPADVAARPTAATARIDVVLNWHEELQTRVPVP